MSINNDHLTGVAVGLGAAALGFYLYKRNQQHVDQWLQQQGINLPKSGEQSDSAMSMEELTRQKERMEDLIAEREMQVREQAATEPSPA